MSIKIFFVRHGQSEANLRNDYYNDEEARLTELGRAQAARTGYKIRDMGVDFTAIFCSPYRRARETCKIALEQAGMRNAFAMIDERLGERKFDGLVGREITKEHNRELYDYASNTAERDGVETLDELERRAHDFIRSLVHNYHGGNFLVFSHGAFGLAFRAAIEGRPQSGNLFDWKLLKNGEMIILEKIDI